jgi:hypothetical protein
MIAYIIGFFVCFISAIEKFYGKEVINIQWWIGVKEVALEGLVSFLALDQCISLLVPKITKKSKE